MIKLLPSFTFSQVPTIVNKKSLRQIIITSFHIIHRFTIFKKRYNGVVLVLLVKTPLLSSTQPVMFKNTFSRGTYSVIYLIHGYNGNNSQFNNFLEVSRINGTLYFFDYFEKYLKLNMSNQDIHSIPGGISTYARDFFDQMIKQTSCHNQVQVNIIAHSMGGLIARELLRNYRFRLEELGIFITKIMTLGTPHLGTEVTNEVLMTLGAIIKSNWNTPVARSFAPKSSFISRLNYDLTYMKGIEWTFLAGITTVPLAMISQEIIYQSIPGDGLVDWESALAIDLDCDKIFRIVLLDTNHDELINDPIEKKSYSLIVQWVNWERN